MSALIDQAPAPLPEAFIKGLAEILPGQQVLTDRAECWTYGYDNSRRHNPPAVVASPDTHEQVCALLRLCHEHRIPVTARGSGTATTGATVPAPGGLVLSFARMDRILEVDKDNRLMVVQPGVRNQAVQQAAGEAGFFWPPDPTSAAVCTVGGNLACNAAGPRAVKYGTARENTLGLRAVTGDGREFSTGVFTTKGVVGYDLTRLLVGSEGTLAIITEAVLKLTPLPQAKRTLQALYKDMASAAAAVSNIMAQPVTPCALEFMDGKAIAMIRNYSQADLPEEAGAMLMIEVDGPAACLAEAACAVLDAAQVSGCIEVREASTAEEVERLWKTRKALSPALRNVAPKKINEDVVVPVSKMPELIGGLGELGERHQITIVNFGHAGNGNIHVNLLVNPDDLEAMGRAEKCLSEVFDLVLALKGTLSGEHGIGLDKLPFVDRELDAVSLELMTGIKGRFDPAGILNPGKKIPLPGVA